MAADGEKRGGLDRNQHSLAKTATKQQLQRQRNKQTQTQRQVTWWPSGWRDGYNTARLCGNCWGSFVSVVSFFRDKSWPIKCKQSEKMSSNWWCDFVAGWLGGSAGIVVGHPADTVKVVQQVLLLKSLSFPFISSVRSSNSHPDLLLTQHPLFQITPVLNTGLSLSEPLQLYKGYNAI